MFNMDNIEIGKKIYNARKNMSMTRAELGVVLELHETTIKRYEDGDIKTLSIDKLKEFANALDVSPAYLMGWDEELNTLAVKSDNEDWTEEEQLEIEKYKQFVRSKRK